MPSVPYLLNNAIGGTDEPYVGVAEGVPVLRFPKRLSAPHPCNKSPIPICSVNLAISGSDYEFPGYCSSWGMTSNGRPEAIDC
jgi:hypothetical protein